MVIACCLVTEETHIKNNDNGVKVVFFVRLAAKVGLDISRFLNSCKINLSMWLYRKKREMFFHVDAICQAQTTHYNNCYFCLWQMCLHIPRNS